ncbi:hypothetical protein BAOM_2289 [Peribacillus asahii]|uniref:GrpB family protein n=1 Tax=Peribacillus asahii TaxID=228899 RepID=A0A3Q9RNP8_9BACI|nr:hypothetical protein BAOM_2289 [Peribacillus asahii]
MLGLPRGKVFLVPWTTEWEKGFLLKKERIQNIIREYIVNVHHIGSTAVKNLSAKPIIDITDRSDACSYIGINGALSYPHYSMLRRERTECFIFC